MKERAVLPDGRIAEFAEGAAKLLIEGRVYDVWRPDGGDVTENVACSPDDLCGRCALCRLTGAPTGARAVITSYHGPPPRSFGGSH